MVHQFTALWYHSAGQEAISVLLCRDLSGHHGDIVFFDTDIQARPREIIERYGARWSIEVTNRETKQLLGAASLSVAENFRFYLSNVCVLGLLLCSPMVRAAIRQRKKAGSGACSMYRQKKCYTFSDMLTARRRNHFSIRILSEASDINELKKINEPRYCADSNIRK